LLSNFVRTGPAGLPRAILALKDVPMGPAVAHRANPLNECRFRLEEIKCVVAVTGNGHCVKLRSKTNIWVVMTAVKDSYLEERPLFFIAYSEGVFKDYMR
jgi:hypothetical protein